MKLKGQSSDNLCSPSYPHCIVTKCLQAYHRQHYYKMCNERAMCCLDVCLNQFFDVSAAVVLACLGFLSPANRGALMTCAVVLWVLLGTPAGYVSARLYKSKKEITMRSQHRCMVPVRTVQSFSSYVNVFISPTLWS